MKKYKVISKKLFTSSFIASSLLVANAFAAETYYIEIGKPASVEETRLQWDSLSEKYRALSKLKFFPKSVVSSQGSTTHTIQAGPITEKNRAQKICNILFANNIECFVIEGVDIAPPTMSMGMSQAANWQAPAAVQNQETARVEVSGGPQILEYENSPPVAQAPAQPTAADVDVAEAIAVPLSNKTDERMDLASSIGKASGEMAVVSFSSWEPGYLIIESFSSETAANKFWGYITTESPDTAHAMRVKVQRPLLAKRTGGVQLSIGLFENGSSAADFCNSMVPGYDNRLKCIYDISNESFVKTESVSRSAPVISQTETIPLVAQVTTSEPSLRAEIEAEQRTMASDTAPTPVIHSDRGNAYENRRRLLQRRVPAEQAELYRRLQTNPQSQYAETRNKFWTQIVLADSKAEADRRLEEIRNANADVVGDVGSEVLSSTSSHAKYSVRLGPYMSEDDANTVCDNLQLRGVDCLLVTTK